jgi:SNF2 family DNA or RNA helicase
MSVQAVVSAKHKVFGVPFDPALYNVVPNCKILGDQIVVPHTVDTTRLARNLGYRVPAPILSRYDWAGDAPFGAQRITAALLTMNPRAFVLSEIGTGKTRAVLYALDWMLREGLIKHALVAAPLSTLSPVWDAEIFRYFPHLRTQVLHGTRAQRLAALETDADIYIINHDGVETIHQALCLKSFGVFVIDELSYYRNGTTDRWKCMNKLVHANSSSASTSIWGLTGSPTPNEPADAYSQVKLLRPEAVPKYFKHFKELTMTQVSNFRWVAKPTALELVYGAMQPGVRFLRKDVKELPPTSYQTRECPLTPEQTKVYKQLYDKSFHAFQQGQVTALNEGVLMSKLLQVSGGWVYTTTRAVVSLDNSTRINALLEVLEEADGKILVFVEYIHAVNALYTLLMSKGIACEMVTGDTNLAARNRIFADFQSRADGPRVLVAHPRCMSHGLTLTAANTVVWFTPSTSLETYEQANGRVTRPGQTKNTLVVHLCGSAVERKLYQNLQRKAHVQGTLLDMFTQKCTFS